MNNPIKSNSQIVVFNNSKIRRIFYEGAWWFVVLDVVSVLTDSKQPAGYIKDMKRRDNGLNEVWVDLVQSLTVETDGGVQKVNCANTEGIFRIIQSIPSPKAEPFKRWLAKVGYQRVQEIENPELAIERAREIYKAKGYDDAWIEKRMRSIQVRTELTDEWKSRGVGGNKEYAILTAEISKATFDMTPTEYKQLKRLNRENLRDHMTDLELIFSMLGEASTTEIARGKDAQGFSENKAASREGGDVAGKARKDLETRTGKKITTRQNYLEKTQKQVESDD